MTWSNLILLVHVGLAFTLVTGLIGRWSLHQSASRSASPDDAYSLSQAAGLFERLVLLSGPAIIVAGLVTAAAKGYPYLGLTTGWMLLSLILALSFPVILAPLVYLPSTRRFEVAMAEARDQGVMTSALRSAFADPALRLARWYEAIAMTTIVALMVLKPI